jgi:MFS transporter, PPP family, 3-phenylpropionic acid transporter
MPMSPTAPIAATKAPGISPELRTAVFYFTQFMTGGAATVFAGIWFSGKGLSSQEIGVINAVPVLVMLGINLVVGRIADRADDWRQVIMIGAVAAGIFPFGLFFVDGFWGILLFWTLAAVAQMAVGPVADAAAMRITRRRGTDYGAIRAWGTVGYLLVIFVTGYLVVWFGGEIFLPLFVALAVLRGIASLGLPKFRPPRNDEAPPTGATRMPQVMKPWFLLPLAGWAIVFATHLILNAFQGLLWKEQGISEDLIGVLIALGALSEAAMFFAFRRVAGRFSARNLILLSAIVSVARWLAMSFSPGVEILFLLQLFHSVTFALGFLGCTNFIANWTSDDIAAEAQSFSVVLQQGMAVIAVAGFGWLAGEWGARAYIASAAFAALGAALVWISLQLQQPRLE